MYKGREVSDMCKQPRSGVWGPDSKGDVCGKGGGLFLGVLLEGTIGSVI